MNLLVVTAIQAALLAQQGAPQSASVPHGLEARKSPEAMFCAQGLAGITLQLAQVWLREDRHHRNLPLVREVLQINYDLFPRSPDAALVALLLGYVQSTLNQCGCAGVQHSPEEWRKAALSFHRAATLDPEGTLVPGWDSTGIRPLHVAGESVGTVARRAEVACLANLANPLDEPNPDQARAIAAIEAYLASVEGERNPMDFPLRKTLLVIAAGRLAPGYNRLAKIVLDSQAGFDLNAVAFEMLVSRLRTEPDGKERRRLARQLLQSTRAADYARREGPVRCLRQLLTSARPTACKDEDQGRWRWSRGVLQ